MRIKIILTFLTACAISLELFSGMGGFGVALDALGGKCIFMSELEGTVIICCFISDE